MKIFEIAPINVIRADYLFAERPNRRNIMTSPLIILDALPSPTEFYGLYWNKHPFVVRSGVSKSQMSALISGNELAGLAMEEAPMSRMVLSQSNAPSWTCEFGPFSDEDFTRIGDQNWSLLVQNVEQFHPETAQLLRHFNFAPRWLLDDIMVSLSAKGGTVGAHIDSYHVFLVQGTGRRRWKIGREPIRNEVFIEDIDLKVLAHEFDGDTLEVTCGDVLYLPPNFAHEGITLEEALTFSIGFLGPKFSELLGGYSQYLATLEDLDARYVGDGLTEDSAGFVIDPSTVGYIRGRLMAHLDSPDFTQWLVSYFTESSHEEFGNYSEREECLSLDQFKDILEKGGNLIKPEYVKFALTADAAGTFSLGFDGQSFSFSEVFFGVIQKLMKGETVSFLTHKHLFTVPETTRFLLELYNHQALEFNE